jgi:hypothetical protein
MHTNETKEIVPEHQFVSFFDVFLERPPAVCNEIATFFNAFETQQILYIVKDFLVVGVQCQFLVMELYPAQRVVLERRIRPLRQDHTRRL